MLTTAKKVWVIMSMAPNTVKYPVFHTSSCPLQGSRTASIFADETVCIHGHCEVLQGERKCTELMEGAVSWKIRVKGVSWKIGVE